MNTEQHLKDVLAEQVASKEFLSIFPVEIDGHHWHQMTKMVQTFCSRSSRRNATQWILLTVYT